MAGFVYGRAGFIVMVANVSDGTVTNVRFNGARAGASIAVNEARPLSLRILPGQEKLLLSFTDERGIARFCPWGVYVQPGEWGRADLAIEARGTVRFTYTIWPDLFSALFDNYPSGADHFECPSKVR